MKKYNPNWKWAVVRKGSCHPVDRFVHQGRAISALAARSDADQYEVIGRGEVEQRGSEPVMVKSLMSNKMVEISRSMVGGPCDPSTERYWSM